MSEYTEITPFNRDKFVEHITLLKRCSCDQCKEETDKAIIYLNEYDQKSKAGLDLLEKVFRPKNKL